MSSVSFLLKPASSLCNLRCKYCFYADVSDLRQVKSYGRMSQETADQIIEKAFAYADDVTFGFQGGEPTLAGLPFFEYFVKKAADVMQQLFPPARVHYTLQTNGTLLDENWCRFLKQHNYLVGLSLDGSAAFHDQNRLDAKGRGTYASVHHSKQLLDQFGISYNILWVLTNYTARFPRKVWKFLCDEDIGYVQFVPCLGPLDGTGSPFALTPRRFCQFYTELFSLWDQDLRRGQYRSIKFFDDVFNLILRRQVTACGLTGQCSMQMIVEGDGSVYPCDFYVLDQWNCGSILEKSVADLLRHPVAENFLRRDHQVPELCHRCKWWNLCGSGCMRMRESMYVEPGNSYCGYSAFLEQNQDKLMATAQFLQNSMP